MRRRFMMGQVYFSIDNYLTIEALEDNLTVKFPRAIEYGIDGKGWSILPKNTDTPPINASQTISFRANFIPLYRVGIGTFTISKKCNLKGNCMSMLFGDNAVDNYSLSGKNYAFYRLFSNCSNIVNVSSNFLPATTLAYECYYGMFSDCLSLTTAPELPATKLVNRCYSTIFNGCKKLNYIKMLATDISASSCLTGWVNGVASTGTFVKNSAMTTLPTGYNGIPSGWTVIND